MRGRLTILYLLGLFPLSAGAVVTDTVPEIHVLDNVEVTASEMIQTQDKMIVNVSKQVKKHSYDGYSMLSKLMLPGLDVDPFSSRVSAYGANVLLTINGIKASANDVKTINPKDVIRIDYYTGFNPDFPTEQYVIDFVVKIRDYGGAVALQTKQNINRPAGYDLADWRTFAKKSEFGVRLTGDYNHFVSGYSHGGYYYNFSDVNVMRLKEGNTLSTHDNNLKGTVHFLHWFKKGVFKTAFALEKTHAANLEATSEEIEENSSVTFQTADIRTHKDRTIPSLLVSYDHTFANKSSLTVSFNGDYASTSASRDYLSTQQVRSNTGEGFYSLRPRANFQIPVSKRHNLFAEAEVMYRHSDIEYTEDSHLSRSELTNIWSDIAVGDNFFISRNLSLFLMTRVRYGATKTLVHKENEFFLSPTARLSWKLPQKNRIRLEFSMAPSNPTLAMYSPEEKWIDPFTLRKGNPYIKSSNSYNMSVIYTNNHGWGYFQFMTRYNMTSNAVYLDITADDSRKMIVQTFYNGGNYGVLHIEPSLMINLIPNKLRLLTAIEFLRVDARTYTHLHSDCLIPKAGAVYMDGGVQAQINFSSPRSSIDQFGEKYDNPLSLDLSAGYSIDNWYFSLSCRNPFMKSRQRISLSLPKVGYNGYNWYPRVFDNNLSLLISYRFNYGKPRKKYQDVEIEQTENSAILGH